MINITFIGNCQTICYCFYFQQLLDPSIYTVRWLLYNDSFKIHLGEWSDKCKNKILEYDECINIVKESDVILYQPIDPAKTRFCSTTTLDKLKKQECILIRLPYIYLDYDKEDESIEEMERRETLKNVDVKVSHILKKYRSKNLMLKINHPKTFLILEVMKELCSMLSIEFFKCEKYNEFLQNENYIGLP